MSSVTWGEFIGGILVVGLVPFVMVRFSRRRLWLGIAAALLAIGLCAALYVGSGRLSGGGLLAVLAIIGLVFWHQRDDG